MRRATPVPWCLRRGCYRAARAMPPTKIELVKARATLGETVARLREVFGRYVEKPVF